MTAYAQPPSYTITPDVTNCCRGPAPARKKGRILSERRCSPVCRAAGVPMQSAAAVDTPRTVTQRMLLVTEAV
jgi:hypothetical protein